jgi:hypothetical protein
MKWMTARACFLATFLAACQHSNPVEQRPAVVQPREAEDQAERVYVEAVLLLVPRDELKNLPPVMSQLASRTDGTVVSAPHLLLEADRPEDFRALIGADRTSGFTWMLGAHALADGTVQLGVGVIRKEPDEEVSTTLVLDSGEIAILPTLFSAPEEKVLVLVLQPEIIRTDEDLERILGKKRQLAEAARRGGSAR